MNWWLRRHRRWETAVLFLHIEVGPKGDFAIGSCWFGREGEQLSRDCDARTSGRTSPLQLGVLLHDFVDRELEWVDRRRRQPRSS